MMFNKEVNEYDVSQEKRLEKIIDDNLMKQQYSIKISVEFDSILEKVLIKYLDYGWTIFYSKKNYTNMYLLPSNWGIGTKVKKQTAVESIELHFK